jgi:hypothetical protein
MEEHDHEDHDSATLMIDLYRRGGAQDPLWALARAQRAAIAAGRRASTWATVSMFGGQAFDLGVNAIRLEGLYSDDEVPLLRERPGVHADALVLVAPRDVPHESAAPGSWGVPLPTSPYGVLVGAALLGLSVAALAASIAFAVR